MTEEVVDPQPAEPDLPAEPDPKPDRAVIEVDPEDHAQMQRLADAISAALGGVNVPVGKLQQAARRFVTPRPDEPGALGAVIEDTEGVAWTRWATEADQPWVSEAGVMSAYEPINVVDVKQEGWSKG